MKNARFARIGICLAIILALATAAGAHAFLDHADPKVGSVVKMPPSEIRIWFTQEIEPDFSTIEIRDSNGKQLDKRDSHQDSSDKKLLILSVPKLFDGEYTVIWKVVSRDTHHTHGDFKFTVKAGS